jgi:hypothetical protein
MIRGAASADPDIASLWEQIQEKLYDAIGSAPTYRSRRVANWC